MTDIYAPFYTPFERWVKDCASRETKGIRMLMLTDILHDYDNFSVDATDGTQFCKLTLEELYDEICQFVELLKNNGGTIGTVYFLNAPAIRGHYGRVHYTFDMKEK